MTIREAYPYLQKNLRTIYEEGEASLISEWVLEHLTGTRKTDRALHKEQSLNDTQTEQLHTLMNRLLQHEPVQYVLNEAWFCGLKLYVDRHVLVPRPETEELIEWVISDCRFPIDKLSILDIGTGSGCIALSLKKRLGKAGVTGIDISEDALSVARRNAAELGIDVAFKQTDFLDQMQSGILGCFDIIISNPPYIAASERASMQPNVLKYEPPGALFVPDDDALIFYKAIASFSVDHLNPSGKLYVEINEQFGADVIRQFTGHGFKAEMKKDMQGKDRMVKAWIS